jgi:hypothetical protein
MPPHPVVVTMSGGEHHWFRQPREPISLVKWPGGEVRGIGHFVVGYAVPKGPIPELPEVFWAWAANTPLGSTLKSDRINVEPSVCLGPPTAHEVNYAKKALGNHCYELRHCSEPGRNIKLNVLSFNMGRLIARGWIKRDRVESYFLDCCKANGLLVDDGLAQCVLTIASGINAGMKRPYHEIDWAKLGGAA